MALSSKDPPVHWGALLAILLLLAVPGFIAATPTTDKDDDKERESLFHQPHRFLKGNILEDDASFEDIFPLETPDYIGFTCAVAGLVLAAGGGIGGGGILVPVYILLFEFPVKRTWSSCLLFVLHTSLYFPLNLSSIRADAIPLASVTVLGGAIANNILNYPKRDPRHPDRSCIDWDLMLQLEPMTMAGTLLGAALNDVFPDLLLVILLLILLTITAHKTLSKARSMYRKESQLAMQREKNETESLVNKNGTGVPYGTTETIASDDSSQDDEATLQDTNGMKGEDKRVMRIAVVKLTGLFVVVSGMNLLKGSTSEGGGPAGLSQCGSRCFWLTNLAMFVIIFLFSAWVRNDILNRLANHGPVISDIVWDERNTIAYPCMAILAGLAAGMFGIGGGIVKGPLMLALGVHASVASATSACMILYTSTTATVSYMVFGLLNYGYAIACLVVGFFATLVGQTIMSSLLAKYNRHSYIAFSIGLVVAVSAVAMGIESILSIVQG